MMERSGTSRASNYLRGRPEAGNRLELPALTSIRALFAWWVVMFHFSPSAPFHTPRAVPFISKGMMAVDCFFVLSGFVLCHVHPVIIGGRRQHGVSEFLVNRLARIYPLHFVMLAAFVSLVLSYSLASHMATGGAFAAYTWPALIRQLLLVHGWLYWGDNGAWNVPSWSISSEWGAYLMAPVIFLVLAKARPALLYGLLAALGVTILVLCETRMILGKNMALPRVLLEFCLGAVLRTLLGHGLDRIVRIRNPGLVVGWVAVGFFAFTRHSGLFLMAMVWVMLLLSLRTFRAGGILGRIEAVTIYLGDTSFAVYMCHAFVLLIWDAETSHIVRGPLEYPVLAALFLFMIIQGLASLLHHGVERPAQQFIRRHMRAWFEPARPSVGPLVEGVSP